MKIDRTQTVLPAVYADRALRREMGRRIAAATPNDLLAAYLRQQEVLIVADVRDRFVADRERVERMQERARDYGWYPSTYRKRDWKTARSAFAAVCTELSAHLWGDVAALRAVESDLYSLQIDLLNGLGEDLPGQYTGEARRSPELDRLGELRSRCREIHDRVRARVKEAEDRIARLRTVDERREAFMASGEAVGLERIHGMDYTQFEQLAADLLQRDGLTVVRRRGGARDQGADVIAETADGRRVVVQCKHRRAGAKVDSQTLYVLNGTARQIHGADIVIAMTNREFTQDAVDFGHGQGIHLITESVLTRWATWGDPACEILDLPVLDARAEQAGADRAAA